MRPLLISVLAVAASGCQGILGIPSEGELGCPEPCMVTVSGRAVRAESLGATQQPLANVTVRLTSVTPARAVTTGADGRYSFADLAPGTPLQFELSIAQSNPDPGGQLDTRYVAGMTGTSDLSLDLPVVQFQWLAKVAFQCGIFPTLDDALFETGTTNVNPYFLTRSTIIGQILNEDGTAAPLDRADVGVVLNGRLNFNQNPDDSSPFPATVCFLEPDNTAGEFKGVNATNSNSGRFVLYRARSDLDTGTGTGEVQVPGFPAGPVKVQSGTIGFARVKLGEGPPLPERPRTFERDVYHFFTDNDYRCAQLCHHPPDGAGFTSAPQREGPGGILYPADWSGTPDQVYDALTKPFDTDCAAGGTTAARVCKANPEASLLYAKPAGLVTHAGIAVTTDDVMVVTILKWIRDGAVLR